MIRGRGGGGAKEREETTVEAVVITFITLFAISSQNIEVDLGVLQLKVTEVVQEGRDMVGEKYFVESDERVVGEKLADVERKVKELGQRYEKERLRLECVL